MVLKPQTPSSNVKTGEELKILKEKLNVPVRNKKTGLKLNLQLVKREYLHDVQQQESRNYLNRKMSHFDVNSHISAAWWQTHDGQLP